MIVFVDASTRRHDESGLNVNPARRDVRRRCHRAQSVETGVPLQRHLQKANKKGIEHTVERQERARRGVAQTNVSCAECGRSVRAISSLRSDAASRAPRPRGGASALAFTFYRRVGSNLNTHTHTHTRTRTHTHARTDTHARCTLPLP